MQPCMMPQTALNYPPRFQKCCPLFAVPMHHDRHGGDSYREKSKRQREAGTVWDKSHALSHVYCYGRLFAKLHANFNIAEYRCFFFSVFKTHYVFVWVCHVCCKCINTGICGASFYVYLCRLLVSVLGFGGMVHFLIRQHHQGLHFSVWDPKLRHVFEEHREEKRRHNKFLFLGKSIPYGDPKWQHWIQTKQKVNNFFFFL